MKAGVSPQYVDRALAAHDPMFTRKIDILLSDRGARQPATCAWCRCRLRGA
jgi:hypothetical protein